MRDGMAIYGSTKRAVAYFTEALVKELEQTPVKLGAISPGMVATDLVLSHYDGRPQDLEKAKQALNLLGERVETVAPWIVERVLSNDKAGANIRYLTTRRLLRRLLSSKFRKRDLFAEA
jgi:short-subunit dehydrogenase